MSTLATGIRVNLIPRHRMERRARRGRVFVWCVIGAIYAAALLGACVVAGMAAGKDTSALRGDLDHLGKLLAESESRHKTIHRALDQNATRLASAREVSDHPDWSLLLAAVADQLGDDVVLQNIHVTARPDGRAAMAPRVAGPASPEAMAMELRGYAGTQPAVSALLVRLQDMGLFTDVKLVRSAREPFLTGSAVAFQVHCTISGEEGAP
jgi:Tfp pilus assembly protein PilN